MTHNTIQSYSQKTQTIKTSMSNNDEKARIQTYFPVLISFFFYVKISKKNDKKKLRKAYYNTNYYKISEK
jgi:hypothetical protein